MADYKGLTRNSWPGTWSPSSNHPIVLDTEMRGGLRYVSGDSGDRVSDITGQRLQDGMLIYVKKAHEGFDSEQYYSYKLQAGQYRDSATGELPNNSNNWEDFRPKVDSASATSLIDSDYINARVDSARIVNIINEVATFDSDNVNGIVDSRVDKAFIDALNVDADTLDGQDGLFYRDWTNVTNKPTILDLVDVSNQITADVDKAFVDALNVDADTLDGQQGTYYLDYNNFTNTPAIQDSVDVVGIVDSAYVRARVRTNQDLYTTSTVTFNQINGPANFIIDPSTVGDNTGTVQILGNLQVEGTQTTINSTTVSINDKNIVLADSAGNAAAADGAGITINGANATMQYSASGDKFVFNKPIEGEYLGFDSDFGTKTTDDLTEGSTNLYYTKARADSDIAASLNDSGNTVNITINNVITDTVDSAYVLARISEAPFLDSADAIQLIDSAYVQARVDSAYISTVYDQSLNTTDDVIFNTVQAPVTFRAKNDAGSTLNVGEVVYIKGVDGNTPTVDRADADDANKMPAFGIVAVAANDQANVEVVTFGALQNVNTTGFNLRDTLYVSTTPGQLTNVKPSGTTSLIQNIAKVVRVASNGLVRVGGAGRTNDTPNLNAGQIFYGNDSNCAVATDLTSVVDSAYVQARVDSARIVNIVNLTAIDSENVVSIIDSHVDQAFVNALNVDADLLDGQSGSFYLNYNNFTNRPNILDSEQIKRISVDSGEVINLIDSAYVRARQITYDFLDSAEAINLIDSAYIELRRPAETIFSVVNNGSSAYTFSGDGFSSSRDNPTLYLTRGKTYKFNVSVSGHPFQIRVSNGGSAYNTGVTNNGAQTGSIIFTPDMNAPTSLVYQCTVHSGMVGNIVILDDTDLLRDSAFVTGIIDSAYINARTQAGTDSATVISLITSTVDSAYVAAREANSGGGGGGTDSATVISLIQSTADSAYVQARQLNETATPLTQSTTNFVATNGQTAFTGLSIDSDKFQVYLNGLLLPRADYTHNSTRIDLAVAADSADVLEVLKFTGNDTGATAFQQRHYIYTATSGQTVFSGADDNGTTLSYTQGRINVYLNGLLLLDSADYTQNGAGTTVTFTSGVTAGHIVNIQTLSGNTGTFSPLEQTLYEFTADSGQTVFTGNDNNSAPLEFTNDKVTVYLNGILLSSTDYTLSSGDTVTLDAGADSGNLLTVAKLSGNNIGLDSAAVSAMITASGPSGVDSAAIIAMIDSAYVNARVSFDSNTVTQLVDSAYIQLRDRFQDSSGILAIVDSAYVQARQLTYDFLDSAEVINLIDSAYVQARQTTGGGGTVDSAYVLSVVDSAAVPFTQTFFHFTADSGQTVFSGADDDSETLSYNASALSVYLNGILLVDSVDYTAINGTSVTLLDAAALGDVVTVLKYSGNSVGVDSATVLNLIDSAYINARVGAGTVEAIVDSAYIQLRDRFQDSAGVTAIIDSAYVAARSMTDIVEDTTPQLGGHLDGNGFDIFLDDDDILAWGASPGRTNIQGKASTSYSTNYIKFNVRTGSSQSTEIAKFTEDDGLYTTIGLNFANWNTALNDYYDLKIKGPTSNSLVANETIRFPDSSGTVALTKDVLDSAAIISLITGSDLDMQGNKVLFGNVYDSTGLFPSATTYHGMFAHAHNTGAGYFAHAGNWVRLANYSELSSYGDANVTALVDSAYVQARQTTGGSGGIDSAAVINLVDSAYVQARQSAGGGGGGSGTVDSAQTISLIEATVDSDYIGTKVDFTRGEFVNEKSQYTATAAQTVFNHSSIDPTHLDVYLNGILQVVNDDYTATSSAVTFSSGVDSGYSVTIVEKRGRVLTQRGLVESKYYFTTSTPTTSITGTDDNGLTLDYSVGNLDVYLNGMLLKDSDDYSTNAGTTVTLVSATDSNDLVTLINRKGVVVTPNVKNYEFTATGGQTVFSGADINSNTLAYVPGAVQVHLNGILLRNADFTAVNGTSVTLATSASLNDELVVSAFSNPGQNMDLYKFTADSGQTIFSGNDLTGASLAYQPGNIQVFMNGLLLNDSDDYTASNGMSVVLTSGADASDEIKIASFVQNADNIRTNAWTAPTDSAVSASAGDKLFIDVSSSAKTVTLPSSATMGDEIRIIDVTGNAATNNITVDRNGHSIQGSAANLTININRAGIGLVYYNSAQGWVLIEN